MAQLDTPVTVPSTPEEPIPNCPACLTPIPLAGTPLVVAMPETGVTLKPNTYDVTEIALVTMLVILGIVTIYLAWFAPVGPKTKPTGREESDGE
jgi:hypothetical protein